MAFDGHAGANKLARTLHKRMKKHVGLSSCP